MKRYSIFILLFVWVFVVFLYFKGFEGLVSIYKAIKTETKIVVGKTFVANYYEKTPCEGKKFTLKDDMILLDNRSSSMVKSFYEITRFSLQDYKKYLKNEDIDFYVEDKSKFILNSKNPFHKEIKLYKKDEVFRILGYYIHESKTSLFSKVPAFLIETNDGKKAWIMATKFDSKKCKPAFKKMEIKTFMKKIDTNYKKTQIKSTKSKEPFLDSDKTYEISKKEFLKFQRLIDPNYGKVLSKKEQEKEKFVRAFEKKDYMYMENVVEKHLDFFDDKVLESLKNTKKNDINYIRKKSIYYRVKYLKEHPNAKITHFSIKVSKNSNKDKVKIITQDSSNWSELMKAIKAKNRNKIDSLLAQNPNLNFLTNNGSNALLFAVKYNDFITYKALVQKGMDINFKNNFGLTPLHIAIISDAYEIAEDLINLGAKVDVLTKDGNPSTPLMLEARKKDANYDILDLLLSHGASMSRKYPGGNTILIEAARVCNRDTIAYLLKHGANGDEKNRFGQDYEFFESKCPNLPHF